MAAPATRELSESEARLGLYVFALIYDWKRWVHRRVEQVDFSGTVTYRRRTSIDFTIPKEKQTPLATPEGKPVFCVPLAFLRKQRLRRFSLRDEHGQALPLLTRRKNGAIATGVLQSAAQEVMQTDARPPPGLYEDLWIIANGSPTDAVEAWSRLGDVEACSDEVEASWRYALSGSISFRALAADFARNFLVLTILPGNFNERRIVKFDYEQQGDVPESKSVVRRRERRRKRESRRLRRRHKRATVSRRIYGGIGTLVVHVRDPAPLEGARVAVCRGREVIQVTTTDEGGRAEFVLQPGAYEITVGNRRGAVESVAPSRHVEVRVGRRSTRDVVYTPVPHFTWLDTEGGRPLSLGRKLLRSIAWRARPIVIPTPAAGQGSSFHLEVEAPEGLKLTRGKLQSGRAPLGEAAPGAPDLERGSLQRSHLYLDEVPQGAAAFGVIHLRPRASLIVRAGFFNAAVAAALLGVVAKTHDELVGVVGSVAALLLFVPGGLSAYTARPRENPLTGSMVFGLRALTILAGALSLTAACVMIFSRTWTISDKPQTIQPGEVWAGTGCALAVLAGLCALIMVILGVAWWWTVRTPESRAP